MHGGEIQSCYHHLTIMITDSTSDRNGPTKFVLLVGCVEVLRPSQPNGVMSSVVSLPKHTFTGQA